MMTDNEFLDVSEELLDFLQNELDEHDLDLDYQLNGGVLQIEFSDGEKLIINRHLPNREMWVAARSGGFHFALTEEGYWRNTRDGSDFFAMLADLISRNTGEAFTWKEQ